MSTWMMMLMRQRLTMRRKMCSAAASQKCNFLSQKQEKQNLVDADERRSRVVLVWWSQRVT